MVMELFPPHHRTMAGVAAEVFWAIGLILLAVCCYFVQHWRHVQLAISIPTLVTLLYIWWVCLMSRQAPRCGLERIIL